MSVPLESVAHIIQVALTPVFLPSGVGTLLNVFATRLARVTDHMEHATLFVGALRNSAVAWVLFLMFGAAVACTIGALTAFLAETMLSWHGLRDEGPLPRPKIAPRA